MRKLLSVFIFTLGLWLICALVIFVFNDIQLLDQEEQAYIKMGKTFWQWQSEYGPLAVHYVERGEGENHLVLLHGFRAHTYTWNQIGVPLAEKGYHVWAVDLVGFGLSDKPQYAQYSVDFFLRQILAFLDAQGIEKAHLVGSSMGGGLALNIALEHPEQVKSLTLLAALGYPLDLPYYITLGRYIDQLWAPLLGPTMVRYALQQVTYKQERVTDEQVAAYSLPYRLPGGLKTSLLTLQNFDKQRLIEMERRYSSLNHPVLVIWGKHDSLLPLCHYENFIRDFPHAKTILLEECGHIPQEEEPQEVVKAMEQFLQQMN